MRLKPRIRLWLRRRNAVARLLYCRYPDCAEPYVSEAGYVPSACPFCGKDARWTTIPGNRIVPDYDDPKPPYELWVNDKRFLKSLRILPD